MKKINITALVLTFSLLSNVLWAQGSFSGEFMAQNRIFVRDTLIKASNNDLYDKYLSGTQAWLSANYNNTDWGLNAGLRLDVFNNSNLHNPTVAYSNQGIGMWFIRKKIKNLTVTGGYIYDQLGSGLTLRAFEDRFLGIDNAIRGIHVVYQINDNWRIKALTGRQKNRFLIYEPVIKGGQIDGTVKFGEEFQIVPGATFSNRTLDEDNMRLLAAGINAMEDDTAYINGEYVYTDKFIPKYNTYSFSVFNTLNYKSISWYAEYAFKTHEALSVTETDRYIINNDNEYIDRHGSVMFTTLSYATKGFGITGQFKRTENFRYRVTPFVDLVLNQGFIAYIPPMARQNSLLLLSRYNAQTLELGEMAFQVDVTYTPYIKGKKKKTSFNVNYANIRGLDNRQFFQEVYFDVTSKISKKLKTITGAQYIFYDRKVYQGKGGNISAIDPHTEIIYKIDRKKTIRTELQYQLQLDDKHYGSWAYGLVEFSWAPHWTVSISDMVTMDPHQYFEETHVDAPDLDKKVHFYTIFASYTKGANRFTIARARQVEGIVCTGGICRFEPAFNGYKFSITSNF